MNIQFLLMGLRAIGIIIVSVKFDGSQKAVTVVYTLAGRRETKNIPFTEIEAIFNTPPGEPDQARQAVPGSTGTG